MTWAMTKAMAIGAWLTLVASPERDERRCENRVSRPAAGRHAVHEVQGHNGEQRQQGVHGVEVTELNVDDGQTDEGSGQKAHPPPIDAAAQEEHGPDGGDVGQRRDDPAGQPQVVVAQPRQSGRRVLDQPQRVERETAVREPPRVPGAFAGVQEQM